MKEWSGNNMGNTMLKEIVANYGVTSQHFPGEAEEHTENLKINGAGMSAVGFNLEILEYETGVPMSCGRCSPREMGQHKAAYDYASYHCVVSLPGPCITKLKLGDWVATQRLHSNRTG
jgi:hypothetical protein